jgi:hypothetical protein
MLESGIQSITTMRKDIKELKDSGVITRKRRLGKTSITFVNIDVLRQWAYTDEDLAQMHKVIYPDGTEITPSEQYRNYAGNSPETTMAVSPEPEGLSVSKNPKNSNQKKETTSVSVSTDTDSSVTPLRTGSSLMRDREESASQAPYLPDDTGVPRDGASRLFDSSSSAPTGGGAEYDDTGAPADRLYEDAVRLSAIWQATHADDYGEDGPTPNQMSQEEGVMVDLILDHGRDSMENLLKWLPVSDYWYRNPRTRLTRLNRLKHRQTWDYVFADYSKYVARAAETGTEARCHNYLENKFLATGGEDADTVAERRLMTADELADAVEEEQLYYDEDMLEDCQDISD